jgi:hypothetical protein
MARSLQQQFSGVDFITFTSLRQSHCERVSLRQPCVLLGYAHGSCHAQAGSFETTISAIANGAVVKMLKLM